MPLRFTRCTKQRPFFGELTEYMTSAPIVAAILEKDNAVADFRTLIGATNPAEAAPGTIRADFAESIAANAVHGSDSDENAAIEGAFFFSARESSKKPLGTERTKIYLVNRHLRPALRRPQRRRTHSIAGSPGDAWCVWLSMS